MKRWIHSSTENLTSNIKGYLSAWARFEVNKGQDVCSLDDFKQALKNQGLKYSQSRYDYYLACYNHLSELKTKIEILENELDKDQYVDPDERYDDQEHLNDLNRQFSFYK